jgi:hypothetical protein
MSFIKSISEQRPITIWKGFYPNNAQQEMTYLDYLVWEIPALPDFSAQRFASLGDSPQARPQKLLRDMATFLQAFHREGNRVAVAIRLVHIPEDPSRISLFLVVRVASSSAKNPDTIAQLRRNYEAMLPSNYRYEYLDPYAQEPEQNNHFQQRRQLALTPRAWGNYALELCKPISHLPSVKNIVPIDFQDIVPDQWGVPARPLEPKLNTFEQICSVLISQPGRVMVDLTLCPTQPGKEEQQQVSDRMELFEKYGRDQYLGDGVTIPADTNAKAILGIYEQLQQSLIQTSHWFFYAFRVFSDTHAPQNVIATLDAQATANQMSVVDLHANRDLFDLSINAVEAVDIVPQVNQGQEMWMRDDTHQELYRLHKMVSLDEVSGFWTLPIPLRSPFPGFDLDAGQSYIPLSGRTATERKIKLGETREGKTVDIALEILKRHMLVVGTPGSGKTTTIFHILHHLRANAIPWLVMEPAKTEYRALRAMFPETMVFTLGDERISPFRFNPFSVPRGTPVEKHISRLNGCFIGAFNLFDPLPMLLDKAIRELYAKHGWSTYDVGGTPGVPSAPTLAGLQEIAEDVVKQAGYDGETGANIKAALLNRIESLQRGSIGRMINTSNSIPLELLLQQPVVLELDALNADEKALMMMFVFTHLYEYAKANRPSGVPLTHVLVLEEAHNLIGHGTASSDDRANPKAHAIELFTNMLAEMRALGEGIVIIDQLPSALAPQAMKNTNIKILHQLTAGDDRESIGLTMGIQRDDPKITEPVAFQTGEAFVFATGMHEIQRMNIQLDAETERLKSIFSPDDEILRYGNDTFPGMLAFIEQNQDVFMPFQACSRYCRHCTPIIREWSERSAQQLIEKAVPDVTLLEQTSEKVASDVALLEEIRELGQFSSDFVASKMAVGSEHNMGLAFREQVNAVIAQPPVSPDPTLKRFCAYIHFMQTETGKTVPDHEEHIRQILITE